MEAPNGEGGAGYSLCGGHMSLPLSQFLCETRIHGGSKLLLGYILQERAAFLLLQLRSSLQDNLLSNVLLQLIKFLCLRGVRHGSLGTLLLFASGGSAEPFQDGLDHLGEPEVVEGVEDHVRDHVGQHQPGWGTGGGVIGILGELKLGLGTGSIQTTAERGVVGPEHLGGDIDRLVESGGHVSSIPGLFQGVPHVSVDVHGSPCTPDKTTAEEGEEEHHAVVPLKLAAGHVDLVKEPVDVEERAGELVEDEDGGVVVHERSLQSENETVSWE